MNSKIYNQYMYSYPHKKSYRPIEPHHISIHKKAIEKKSITLYAHIPFCSSKCGYCNLLSIVNTNEGLVEKYIDKMKLQADDFKNTLNLRFNSIVVGGGTPLHMTERQLDKLFRIFTKTLDIDMTNVFSCIETSPNDTSIKKLNILVENNVERVSIGVQSFNENELEILKRQHSIQAIDKSVSYIKKLGFKTLNMDIIYGIPTQTENSLKESLSRTIEYAPEEVFLYPLYIRANKNIKKEQPDMLPLYEYARDFLVGNGYNQKSMRQFSKIKVETKTCGFENMISLGVGGRSYINDLHACTPYSDQPKKITNEIKRYIDAENNIIDFGYILSDDETRRRFIIKNLFVTNGLDRKDYETCFSTDIIKDYPIIETFIQEGFCNIDKDKVVLNKKGIAYSDSLAPRIISKEAEKLMKSWSEEL